MKKTIEEAIDVIEIVADNEYFYDSERSNNRGVMKLNKMDAILAQNKMITKKLADLTKQMEKNHAVAIHTKLSPQSESNTEEGVDWEQANYIGNSSRQEHDPYFKTYNPGWKNHPNFWWGNQPNQNQNHRLHNFNQFNNSTHHNSNQSLYQPSQNNYSQPPYQAQANQPQHPISTPPSEDKLSSIKAMLANLCMESDDMKKLKEEVRSNLQNQDAAIQKLEVQIGSGKELKETSKETQKEEAEGSSSDKEEAQTHAPNPPKEKEVLRSYVPKAPYPQRLMKNAKDNQFSKFLEIFKRLQINIPFAEVLEQMPLYAKFLKELMTKKRSWRNDKTVVLTEECSTIIQYKLRQKLKDPGSFQIPCIIGEITVEKALCDLEPS
ncbi:uncharacterized protein LOC107474211 [Arachis duranensis]|uniref:Uncharacterized protein LOC107474211 n=1 Tax=Arachis duranensis TaxID=130453 RepID=A0A6P4CDI0_ARADU|nr:uncharacterized protein LOC107474211 [Arachis duranensis]